MRKRKNISKKTKSSFIPLKLEMLGDEGCHIFCKIKISGKKYRALIDTGASKSVVSKRIHAKLGNVKVLDIENEKTTGVGASAIESEFLKLKKIKLGKSKIKKLIVGSIDVSHIDTMYKNLGIKPFDLLIGGDILQQVNAIIEYENLRLIVSTIKK